MWSGEQCLDPCSPGCKQCSQNGDLSCELCHDERYGESCELNCSSECKLNNTGQTCNKITGFCTVGCKAGAWGETCKTDAAVDLRVDFAIGLLVIAYNTAVELLREAV